MGSMSVFVHGGHVAAAAQHRGPEPRTQLAAVFVSSRGARPTRIRCGSSCSPIMESNSSMCMSVRRERWRAPPACHGRPSSGTRNCGWPRDPPPSARAAPQPQHEAHLVAVQDQLDADPRRSTGSTVARAVRLPIPRGGPVNDGDAALGRPHARDWRAAMNEPHTASDLVPVPTTAGTGEQWDLCLYITDQSPRCLRAIEAAPGARLR